LPAEGLGDGTVRLRPPCGDDAHAIARGCSDPAVARWTKVPSPYTLEDARAWIATAESTRERETELALVLVRPTDDRVVGGISLRFRDGSDPHGDIGYWVAADSRGAGLGARAVRLLTAYALDELGLPWVEIAVSPRNEASRRVALSAGFESEGTELREFKGALEEFELFRRGT
jgi:RimJ/RimL family protein N-acetyltransferase